MSFHQVQTSYQFDRFHELTVSPPMATQIVQLFNVGAAIHYTATLKNEIMCLRQRVTSVALPRAVQRGLEEFPEDWSLADSTLRAAIEMLGPFGSNVRQLFCDFTEREVHFRRPRLTVKENGVVFTVFSEPGATGFRTPLGTVSMFGTGVSDPTKMIAVRLTSTHKDLLDAIGHFSSMSWLASNTEASATMLSNEIDAHFAAWNAHVEALKAVKAAATAEAYNWGDEDTDDE